ncbi:MAG: phosphoribosyltransferase [Aquificota bacterium]|nr:phosphoribosyltransferase [Aquificota bacterium]
MIFETREEAGRVLAEDLKGKVSPEERPIVLAIPRGGVPVAYAISRELGFPMSIVVVRKLGLPWNEEAGFGAVDPDGSTYLDEDLISRARLDPKTVRDIARKELEEIRSRERRFVPDGYPCLEGRTAVVVDDGIATGYTAIAASGFAKKRGAGRVIVAVPVCPKEAGSRFAGRVDEFLCHHTSGEFSFAVGMFYRDFHQLTDEEVLDYIRKAKENNLFEP